MNELVCFALIAFFPRTDGLPGLADLDVGERVARLRRESTLLFWTGLVAASIFFQLTPILTLRRPYLAVLLSADELDEHANNLATYRVYVIRQVVMLLKLAGGLFWAESSEIRASLHLPPYPPDPGTRRLEPVVPRTPIAQRAPDPALVQLGVRERERGRDAGHHDAARGGVA